MGKLLTLSIPGAGNSSVQIEAPSGVPTGGLSGDGGKFIGWAITLLLIAAVILALGFIVYGGISWTTSGGDKEKVASARKTITFAVIGLILCFLAFFLVNLIGGFFGLDLLHVTL